MNILKKFIARQSTTQSALAPIEKFERGISTWPADEAKTALLVLQATIKGDQATIDKLFGDLTLNQVKAVERTLREIESK